MQGRKNGQFGSRLVISCWGNRNKKYNGGFVLVNPNLRSAFEQRVEISPIAFDLACYHIYRNRLGRFIVDRFVNVHRQVLFVVYYIVEA